LGITELFSSFQTTAVTQAQVVPHNKEGEMNEHVTRAGGSTETLRVTVRGFRGKKTERKRPLGNLTRVS